jgi:hypothetical protein
MMSQEWAARWQSLIDAGHPLALNLVSRANRDPALPINKRYEEDGTSMAYMLMITGDEKYAQWCWDSLPLFFTTNANWWREELIRGCICYEALKKVGFWEKNPDKKQQFFDVANQRCALALSYQSLFYGDSDQVLGALAAYAFGLCTKDEGNPLADQWINAPENELLRQQVVSFVQRAKGRRQKKGGQWIESSDYNHNTTRIGALVLEYLRAKTGNDYIPEYRDWFEEAAVSEMGMSYDFKTFCPWGDVEHGHSITPWEQKSHLYCILGITGNPMLRRYVREFETADPAWTSQPWTSDFGAFLPPDGPEEDWRGLPMYASRFGVNDNAGISLTSIQDDVFNGGSFGTLFADTERWVDHQLRAVMDLCFYFRGTLTFSHPICYMGLPETYNTPLIYGMAISYDWGRGECQMRLAYEETPDYVYSMAAKGGSIGNTGYIAPGPTFLHEVTRSMVYLPGGANGQTIVVHARDHVTAPFPRGMSGDDVRNTIGANFSDTMVAQINATRRKQQIFHATGEPAVDGKVLTWDAGNGVECRLTAFGDVAITVEREIADNYWSAPVSELGWCIRINYAIDDQDWDSATYVLQAYNAIVPLPEPASIKSLNGEAEGVVVFRPGYPDTVLLFNARPGPILPPPLLDGYAMVADPETPDRINRNRYHSGGFTVDLPGTSDVLLYDLDPTKSEASDQGTHKLTGVSGQVVVED